VAGALAAGLAGPGAARDLVRTRPVPATGERLPVVGLGTARAFDVGDDAAARAARRAVLDTLLAGGGRVVDTSPMYARAEALVGELRATLPGPGRLFLATKVWAQGREAGIEQMRRSRARLGVETIDLMQIHNLLDWRTHMTSIREWRDRGRMRYAGVTHYRVDAFSEVRQLIERERLEFLQISYSLLTPEAERRLLPAAADRGVAVLVNRPFESGALFDRVRGHALPAFARELGIESWAEYCLKFVLSNPAVTCVIPGTGDPAHMAENLRAARGPLPDAVTARRMREHVLAL